MLAALTELDTEYPLADTAEEPPPMLLLIVVPKLQAGGNPAALGDAVPTQQ